MAAAPKFHDRGGVGFSWVLGCCSLRQRMQEESTPNSILAICEESLCDSAARAAQTTENRSSSMSTSRVAAKSFVSWFFLLLLASRIVQCRHGISRPTLKLTVAAPTSRHSLPRKERIARIRRSTIRVSALLVVFITDHGWLKFLAPRFLLLKPLTFNWFTKPLVKGIKIASYKKGP